MTYVPALLTTVTAAVRRRLATTRGAVRDAGASALEFAIIAAVTVLAASVIGGLVYTIVGDRAEELENCSTQAVGSACDDGPGGGGPAGD